MVTDFVTGRHDVANDGWVPMRGIAGDEESRANLMLFKQIQDSRNTHEWTVCLMAHHAHAISVTWGTPKNRGLGVNIERECRGGRLAAWPCDWHRWRTHEDFFDDMMLTNS